MTFRSVPIDEVIARVIRNTRVQDSSYIQDMYEWIPEAMELMKTRTTLSREYQDVVVHFHKAKLPCGLYYLEAVEYNGMRLPYSSTIKHYRTGHNIGTAQDSITTFTGTVVSQQNEVTGDQMWGTQLEANTTNTTPSEAHKAHPSHWYSVELNWLTTSISDGILRLYFLKRPTDENGIPLIPDNGDYKNALYYYIRSQMIACGYQDPVFKFADTYQMFEMHAKRAIEQISYPTPDEKEQQLKTQVRFIPPANYWENFFRVDNHEAPFLQ